MLRDERRSTIAIYIKSQNNRDRSDAKVRNLELYSEAYTKNMKGLNDEIVINQMNTEMNEETLKLHQKQLDADNQSYLAQERLRQTLTPEYNDYVLESARTLRKIQQQIEDREIKDLENQRLKQFKDTFVKNEMIRYCRENNIDEADVMRNFNEYVPGLRERMERSSIPEFLRHVTDRSNIMSSRSLERDETLEAFHNSNNREAIWNEYINAVGDNNMFGDDDRYILSTEDEFRRHMGLMRELISQ